MQGVGKRGSIDVLVVSSRFLRKLGSHCHVNSVHFTLLKRMHVDRIVHAKRDRPSVR
jgi:hypothetical protein